jgi:N-ethylmaleimide reductase
MPYSSLFSPLQLASLQLPNRIVMAPLTRTRNTPDNIPTDIMATYYAQRASAGLLIAEATMVAKGVVTYYRMPGIYSDAHVQGWKHVTDAVHAAGGRIFLQLWHGGRTSHSDLNDGVMPVAPSAVRIEHDHTHTQNGKVPYEMPKELSRAGIAEIVQQFRSATENAKLAGFDGVEIHGANGYLIDQFLRDGTNHRSDEYGGSVENRSRFLSEVLDAAISVYGSDRVGLRISPLNGFNEMKDSDPLALTAQVARLAEAKKIAYLHVMRADFLGQQSGDVVSTARTLYSGVLMGNMGYSGAEANAAIEKGLLNAVAFGHHYISNPDLVDRLRADFPLLEPDQATYYSNGPEGYIDYPLMQLPTQR